MIRVSGVFKGTDGSMGFRKNYTYDLTVSSNVIQCPETGHSCPYDSLEAFFLNWDNVLYRGRMSPKNPKLFDA